MCLGVVGLVVLVSGCEVLEGGRGGVVGFLGFQVG